MYKRQIQGIILYLEQEKEIIDQNNATLRDNLSRIEAQIEAKKREVNSLDKSTDEYKQEMCIRDSMEKDRKGAV